MSATEQVRIAVSALNEVKVSARVDGDAMRVSRADPRVVFKAWDLAAQAAGFPPATFEEFVETQLANSTELAKTIRWFEHYGVDLP